jgi:hypothetical protein
MKRLIFCSFIALPLLAATAVQPVTEVSAQQAIIRVRTTTPSSCTVVITETVGMATPDDNNATLFSGATACNRTGSVVNVTVDNGADIAYVAGLRTSVQGSDGAEHSRSLKANTAYTAVITAGSDSPVTIYFTTGTVQMGNTHVESPPWCSGGFGNYCWPSINWNNQSTTYADPLTGVVLQRVTSPGWWGKETGLANFDNYSGGSGWTNPANILNGTSGTGATTGNTNKIFVAMSGPNFQPSVGNGPSAGYYSNISFDNFLAALTGSCSSSGANCTVYECLTYWDSVTCNTATQTLAIPGSTGTVGFPANSVGYTGTTNVWNPQFQFGEWGGTAPLRADFASAYGPVTTSGTTVTLDASATGSQGYFNVKWKAGALIYIANSGCVSGGTNVCTLAAAPASQESLTVTETMTTNSTPVSYYSMASGVLIWKANATGTVTIGASYSYAYSEMFALQAEGDALICNPNSTTVSYAADGITSITPVPGNLCYVGFQTSPNSSRGVVFLLIPSTGETRLLSPLWTGAGVNSGDAMANQTTGSVTFAGPNFWDKTDPLTFYGLAPVGAATSIIKATYVAADNFKAYSHPLWACGNCAGNSSSGVTAGEDAGGYWYPGSRWSDDPITYTNVTPPSPSDLDVYSQIAANNPYYDTSVLATCGLDRAVQGYAIIGCSAGQQNSIENVSVFNLATGLITAWGSSWSTYPVRWAGGHSSFQSNTSPGYWQLLIDPPGAAGGFNPQPSITGSGPHQITPYCVFQGASCVTNTSLTATVSTDPTTMTCPSNPYGIAGNICIQLYTQDVCSHAPSTGELAKWPCPLNSEYGVSWSQITPLAAGDGLVITSNENMQLLSTTSVANSNCGSSATVDCVEQVWARGQWPGYGGGYIGYKAASTGWTGYAIPPYGNCAFSGCTPFNAAWIPVTATGNINSQWISDPLGAIGHHDYGPGPTTGNINVISGAGTGEPWTVNYNLLAATALNNVSGGNVITSNAPFAGTAPTFTVQSYPSNQQISAPALAKRTFLDFQATNGPVGVGPEEPDAIDAVSYSLVGGTSTVYAFSSIAGAVSVTEAHQKIAAFIGYAGAFLFHDISGPGSSITDSTPWASCLVLAAGECRSGSSAGNVYLAVPNLPSVKSNCYTNWITESLPCAMFASSPAAWLVQVDGSYAYSLAESSRRLTMGLTGWGRQYPYSTFIPESTGTWGMFKADWADGIRSDIFMARLPPAQASSIPRNTFVNVPVSIPAGLAYAEIEFGYMENGAANAYHCTSRQDVCTTNGSPFVYPSIDTRTLESCSSGCTIGIPAIAGRAVYYSIGSSANGATWTYGAPQVGLVQ